MWREKPKPREVGELLQVTKLVRMRPEPSLKSPLCPPRMNGFLNTGRVR